MSKIDIYNKFRDYQKEIMDYPKWSIIPSRLRCFNFDGRETNFDNYSSGIAEVIKRVGWENQAKLGEYFKKLVDEYIDEECDKAAKDAEAEAIAVLNTIDTQLNNEFTKIEVQE